MRMTKRKPDSVGTILREEFLQPYNLTQEELAKAMGVTRALVNELVNNRRTITIDTAIMLGKVFNMSAQFWLNLQVDNSLWEALHDPRRKAKFKRVRNIDHFRSAA